MSVETETKKLDKEWLKLCDDFISNEIVQREEECAGNHSASEFPYIQSYINREFGLEITYRLSIGEGYFCDFRTIVGCPSTNVTSSNTHSSLRRQANTSLNSSNENGEHMFVVVPQSVEDIQNVLFVSIPSIIRLEVLNYGLGFSWDFFEVTRLFIGKINEALRVDIDRESKSTIGSRIMGLTKVPDDVIESSPKIMNSISHYEAKSIRWLPIYLETIGNYISRNILVFLGNHTVRVCFKEGFGFSLELLDVFPRPIDPRIGEFHIIAHTISFRDGEPVDKNIRYSHLKAIENFD